MSRIKFRVGVNNGVNFNLPTREAGNSSVCIGKVSVQAPCISCSDTLSFDLSSLKRFSSEAKNMHETLKGKTNIESKCKTFNLTVLVMPKGHIKIEVLMRNSHFSSPENSEWQTKICFYEYPESLLQLIESNDEIKS